MNDDTTTPKPPKHLKQSTRKWWEDTTAAFSLEPHHLKLLTLAAEAWDRCQDARQAIGEHGLTFTDRFGCPRARPEVAIERDARIGFARILRELGLDVGTPDEARPPRN